METRALSLTDNLTCLKFCVWNNIKWEFLFRDGGFAAIRNLEHGGRIVPLSEIRVKV